MMTGWTLGTSALALTVVGTAAVAQEAKIPVVLLDRQVDSDKSL